MTDMISREAAIAMVHSGIDLIKKAYGDGASGRLDAMIDALTDVAENLRALPAVGVKPDAPHEHIEPIAMKAGDARVLVNGRPLSVDFRVIAEDEYQLLRAQLAEANARADRAEAALAAQIERDAGILDELYRVALKESDKDLSSPWKSHKASAYGVALQAILAQPHDRSALDAMRAEAEARGYELAKAEALRCGWHLRSYDLAKRDAELSKP